MTGISWNEYIYYKYQREIECRAPETKRICRERAGISISMPAKVGKGSGSKIEREGALGRKLRPRFASHSIYDLIFALSWSFDIGQKREKVKNVCNSQVLTGTCFPGV